MRSHSLRPAGTALLGLLLLSFSAKADDLTQQYCSTQNTGSGFTPVNSIYQSDGSCQQTCQDKYAFAILQDENCWCSNYIPAEQQSVSNCNEQCPGYPSDLCGNKAKGLYGYIALTISPSGTLGASTHSTKSSSPSPSTHKSSTSYVSETVTHTVTDVPRPRKTTVVSYVTSSTHAVSTSSPPEQKHTATGSPVTSVIVVTRSGAAVTQTVTTTPMGVAPNASSPQFERKGISKGAVAGIVVGSLIGLAAILLAAFLLWRRKQNADAEGGGQPRPKRNISVLSKTGLLSRNRPSMSENMSDDPYSRNPATRSNSVRHSMLYGAGAYVDNGINPHSPLGSSQDTASSRRHSRPLVYDQRLNPSALFAHQDANGSRVSIQDQQDYSRPLGVMNPDIRRSFDSR